jgi:hypothetical protein
MGKGTEGLEKMPKEFDAENEGVTIPTQVRRLVNPGPSEKGGRTEKSPHHLLFLL